MFQLNLLKKRLKLNWNFLGQGNKLIYFFWVQYVWKFFEIVYFIILIRVYFFGQLIVFIFLQIFFGCFLKNESFNEDMVDILEYFYSNYVLMLEVNGVKILYYLFVKYYVIYL